MATPSYIPKPDLFELYFRLREETEPCAIFHRWALVGTMAAWLGRSTWLPFGSSRIFPNHYIMFVGTPGSRKTTAINQASGLIKALQYGHFAAEKTRIEKFLLDLSGQEEDIAKFNKKGAKIDEILDGINVLDTQTDIPREVFICADEFVDFIGPANTDFQTLLGRFWDWDDVTKPYNHRLLSRKSVAVFQPTVSILSGNTPQTFAECFPVATIGNGFMSRLILIHGEESGKKFHDPPPENTSQKDEILARLIEIKQTCIGPMSKDKAADQALELIYHAWPPLEDARFSHYSSRRYTHLLKLCIVMAAMRGSTVINYKDVVHANTILAHAETIMPKAIGELGNSRVSVASNKIMQVLYETRVPLNAQKLFHVVRNDIERPTQLAEILQSLKQSDKIMDVTIGNAHKGYLPKQAIISRKIPHVDYNYLKGKEVPL